MNRTRKTVIAAAAVVGVLGATAGTANAFTPPPRHAIYFDYVHATLTGQTVKIDGPFYTLASAQTDAANEVRLFAARYPWPRGGVYVTIRKVGG